MRCFIFQRELSRSILPLFEFFLSLSLSLFLTWTYSTTSRQRRLASCFLFVCLFVFKKMMMDDELRSSFFLFEIRSKFSQNPHAFRASSPSPNPFQFQSL